jgi:hypothetical protein
LFFSHSALSLKNKVLGLPYGAPLYLDNYRDDHWFTAMFFAYPTTNGSPNDLCELMRSINTSAHRNRHFIFNHAFYLIKKRLILGKSSGMNIGAGNKLSAL